jgi:hypothetical protein
MMTCELTVVTNVPPVNRFPENRLLTRERTRPQPGGQGRRSLIAPSRRDAERSGAPLTARRAAYTRPAQDGSAGLPTDLAGWSISEIPLDFFVHIIRGRA